MEDKTIIVRQDSQTALRIMKKVSEWLCEQRMPLWNPEDFENGRFLSTIDKLDLYAAFMDKTPVAALLLQWNDPVFWPHAKGDSGFIHKLCVLRQYAGQGISAALFKWAAAEVLKNNRHFLRLDCDATRPKLCKIYEDSGFVKAAGKVVGGHDTALYEMKVSQTSP